MNLLRLTALLLVAFALGVYAESLHFKKVLKNGVMSKASVNLTHAIDEGLVEYDDKTMNTRQGEGGMVVYHYNLRDEFGISDLVDLPCYLVDKYGCFIGKGA
jgi:hypothetical protein